MAVDVFLALALWLGLGLWLASVSLPACGGSSNRLLVIYAIGILHDRRHIMWKHHVFDIKCV